MALIRCPECGAQISDRAASCPQCGYPIAGTSSAAQPAKQKSTKPIVTCRCHWIAYARYAATAFVIIIFGAILKAVGIPYVFALSVLVAVAVIASGIAVVRSQYVEISEAAVTGKRGFINVTKLMSPLDKVQNVAVHADMWGRMLGYATITIATAGTGKTEYVFPAMTGSKKFQDAFISLSGR